MTSEHFKQFSSWAVPRERVPTQLKAPKNQMPYLLHNVRNARGRNRHWGWGGFHGNRATAGSARLLADRTNEPPWLGTKVLGSRTMADVCCRHDYGPWCVQTPPPPPRGGGAAGGGGGGGSDRKPWCCGSESPTFTAYLLPMPYCN